MQAQSRGRVRPPKRKFDKEAERAKAFTPPDWQEDTIHLKGIRFYSILQLYQLSNVVCTWDQTQEKLNRFKCKLEFSHFMKNVFDIFAECLLLCTTNHYIRVGKPPPGLHLDVHKNEKLIEKKMIDEKPYYLFGMS